MRSITRTPAFATLLALASCSTTEGTLLEERELRCDDGVLHRLQPDDRGELDWLPVEDCTASERFCAEGPTGELGCEPWLCPQRTDDRIQLRVTSIQWRAPEGMTNGLWQALVDGSVDELGTLWLIDLEPAEGLLRIGPGAERDGDSGITPEERCSAAWHPTLPRAEVEGARLTAEGRLQARAPSLSLVFWSDESLIPDSKGPTDHSSVPLELRQVDVDLALSPDGSLVGTPPSVLTTTLRGATVLRSRFAASWETGGTATGWIAMEPSREPVIEVMGRTLCGFLSGDVREYPDPSDDCTSPMEEWEHPPEPIPGTDELGWRFEADLGAAAVTIEE